MRQTNRPAVVAAVMLGTFLAALDTSIVGTAMPTVIGELSGISLYSWVFSAYLLTSTTTVPLYGRLADLYGRKPLFLAAAGIFVVGSMLCGVAQSMPQLVAFRALQGLGAGGIIPVTLTIVGDIFSVDERARMQGIFSAVWGTSAVAGPTIGGLIVDYVHWRWVFYINLPFGIASTVLLWLFLHERVERRRHAIDYAGTISLTLSITALLVALLEVGEGWAWLDPLIVAALGLAAVLLAYFVWHERRVPEPILPLELFRTRVIGVSAVAGILIGGAMFGVTSYLPLYVQGVLLGTAVTAGMVVAPNSLGWSLASIVSGRLILRFGYRTAVVAGVTAIVLASLLIQAVPRGESLWLAVAAAGTFGIGMGLSATAFIIAAQNAVGWAERGIATAAITFSRTIGGAVGVAALGTVLSSTMNARLAGLPEAARDTNALLDPAVRATLPPGALDAARSALADALGLVYLGVLAIALFAFVIVLLGFPRGSIADLQAVAAAPESPDRAAATTAPGAGERMDEAR
ncbi:MAG: MDR family MFS transporter [Sphaerobacter sp.]|nr:MDR family MFS transporter [Sphaerobacter sp.]